MPDTRIMIVVNDPEAGQAYADALTDIPVQYDIANSFSEMAVMATETPYNGLIIDILTLVRCSKSEKIIAYDSINLFPVLRVKWETKLKKINLSLQEHDVSTDVRSSFRFFIETRCSSVPARTLRRYKRTQIHLNVLLCTDETFQDDRTEKSFTVTLSRGGVFVHTMRSCEAGDRFWLRFTEFSDATPIPVMVRWSQQWGVSRSIPGLGMSFIYLSEEQGKEIESVLK